MGMMMFTFSDTPLACFRKKFGKANWRDYQYYKLGPQLRLVSTSLYNRLDSSTNLLKENGTVLDMKKWDCHRYNTLCSFSF